MFSFTWSHFFIVTLFSFYSIVIFFFLMILRPPRSTRTDTPFPTRRSSDLFYFVALVLLRHLRDNVGHPNFKVNQRHCAMAPRLIASREACMKTRLSLIIAIVAMFSLPAQASAALAIGSQAPDFTTNGADRKSTRLNSSH